MSKAGVLADLASWLTPDSSGNIVHGHPPAQFDNTGKLATTGFVKTQGVSYAAQVVVSVATTLTAAAHGGREITVIAAVNVTLPLASTCPAGTVIHICSQVAGAGIVRQGSDTISMTPSSTSAVMGLYDSLILMSDGGGVWLAIGGTLQLGASGSFASSLGSSGYQKLPSGAILQWGWCANLPGSAATTVTYPIAFKNGVYVVLGTPDDAYSTAVYRLNAVFSGGNLNNFQMVNNYSGVVSATWFAIGA